MSTSLSPHNAISTVQKKDLENLVLAMVCRVDGAEGALLATTDGFPVASAGIYDEHTQNRIAAIVSSICALGEATGAQMDAGALEIISLKFARRHVQVVSLSVVRGDYALALMARDHVLMGSTLWAIGECAEQIHKLLR